MNKGIMTQVINYLVNFSFNNLNLEKLLLDVIQII